MEGWKITVHETADDLQFNKQEPTATPHEDRVSEPVVEPRQESEPAAELDPQTGLTRSRKDKKKIKDRMPDSLPRTPSSILKATKAGHLCMCYMPYAYSFEGEPKI
jgi:uncharacterized membrane-anchored protein